MASDGLGKGATDGPREDEESKMSNPDDDYCPDYRARLETPAVRKAAAKLQRYLAKRPGHTMAELIPRLGIPAGTLRKAGVRLTKVTGTAVTRKNGRRVEYFPVEDANEVDLLAPNDRMFVAFHAAMQLLNAVGSHGLSDVFASLIDELEERADAADLPIYRLPAGVLGLDLIQKLGDQDDTFIALLTAMATKKTIEVRFAGSGKTLRFAPKTFDAGPEFGWRVCGEGEGKAWAFKLSGLSHRTGSYWVYEG